MFEKFTQFLVDNKFHTTWCHALNSIVQIKSWCINLLRWKPTSLFELEEAENKILSSKLC